MSENNRASVYVHINLVNGKKYFGITSQNPPENRWRNGNGYINNTHFSSAVKKYHWENFAHLILYRDIPIKIAKNIEEMLIQEHMSYDPNFGYNKTMGGELEIPSEETRKKIRKNHADVSGENNPMYGKTHTQESRDAMSKALKGDANPAKRPEVRIAIGKARSELLKNNPELNPNPPKPVEAIDPESGQRALYFKSTQDASRAGFDQGTISKCCNRKRKTHAGLIWRYVEGGNDDDSDNRG